MIYLLFSTLFSLCMHLFVEFGCVCFGVVLCVWAHVSTVCGDERLKLGVFFDHSTLYILSLSNFLIKPI